MRFPVYFNLFVLLFLATPCLVVAVKSCTEWNTIFFLKKQFLVILGHFLPFYSTNNPKNQNFEKMKKAPGDIIIFHKCTKNHDYMLYCSCDMACQECNFHFSFWAIYCPFLWCTQSFFGQTSTYIESTKA